MAQLYLSLHARDKPTGIPIYGSQGYGEYGDCSGLGIRIVRERPAARDTPGVRTPADLEGFFKRLYYGKEKEYFYSFILDARNRIQGIELVSIGSLNASLVHPREVFRLPVILAANSILCSHNHPSGDPSPSREDIDLTRRLAQAGEILGVELVDHIVYGNGQGWVSLREAGLV